MKQATNLVNGSFVRTLGFYNINDGGSAKYKIRTITNEDVVDEAFIIALNDENLIAELIVPEIINPEILGAKGDGTTDDTIPLQKALLSGKKVYCTNKTYIITEELTIDNGNSLYCNNATIKNESRGVDFPLALTLFLSEC